MSEGDVDRPTRLFLVRHGESQVTVDRRIGGPRTCSGLSELGRRQSERLRDRLSAELDARPDLLVSSHYARARETAAIIAPAFGDPEVLVEPGFGEHDPGPELDGMTFVDYVDRFGTPDWDGDPHVEMFVGGETTAEFHLRVGATVSRVLREHEGSSVMVCCHGGVIDATFRQLLRTPPTGGFTLHTLNTSITEFRRLAGGTFQLVRYNDAAHLRGLPSETRRDDG
jgi:probable phosphoglycerate mutase